MPPPAERRTTWFTADRLALAGLLVFTLLVRGGVLWVMRGNLEQDPDAYREIAENLLRHGEFALGKGEPEGGDKTYRPTAYRPPLYPVVLSNLPASDRQHVSLAKIGVLHVLLGVATVWLTWLTARRMCGVGSAHLDQQVVGIAHPTILAGPLLAGLIVACDPILLNQQTLVMTETLAAFLAILSLWCLARFDAARSWFNAALAGGAIGLAALCRPTFLPWLGMVGIAMLIVRGRCAERGTRNAERRNVSSWFDDFGWRAASLAGLAIAAAAIISPWAIRNYRVFGKPIVTTTHGGYTLRLGNNPQFYEWLRTSRHGLPWDDFQFSAVEADAARTTSPGSLSITFWDDWCYHRALDTIRHQTGDFARACVYRIGQLWSPLPHKLTADESTGRRLLRYATCAWYCGVYLLAAIGVWRLRWRMFQSPWIWGVLLCLAFTAVHTFYWTNLRMRAPLVPFVAIVAAAALEKKTERQGGGETKRR